MPPWGAVYRTHATAYKHTHVRVNAASGRCVNAPTRRIRTRDAGTNWLVRYTPGRDERLVQPNRRGRPWATLWRLASRVGTRDETATYTLFSFVLLRSLRYAGTVLRPFSNVSRDARRVPEKKIPSCPIRDLRRTCRSNLHRRGQLAARCHLHLSPGGRAMTYVLDAWPA